MRSDHATEHTYELVNPGVAFATGSTGVHRITGADVRDLDDLSTRASALHSLLSSRGGVLVAYQASVDTAFPRNEFALLGLLKSTVPFVDARYLPRFFGDAAKGVTRDPGLLLLDMSLGIGFTEAEH